MSKIKTIHVLYVIAWLFAFMLIPAVILVLKDSKDNKQIKEELKIEESIVKNNFIVWKALHLPNGKANCLPIEKTYGNMTCVVSDKCIRPISVICSSKYCWLDKE